VCVTEQQRQKEANGQPDLPSGTDPEPPHYVVRVPYPAGVTIETSQAWCYTDCYANARRLVGAHGYWAISTKEAVNMGSGDARLLELVGQVAGAKQVDAWC
jgi:hypothetical protein